MTNVVWISPPESELLTTEIELTEGAPVFSVPLVVDFDTTGAVYFEAISGEFPLHYTLETTGIDTGLFSLTPDIEELDEYVEGWTRPPDFEYDTPTQAGGNYATYGSALVGFKTFSFTIRAWNIEGVASHVDSSGETVYDIDSTTDFDDRSFRVTIRNNWSSDGQTFIREYYEGELIRSPDGDLLTPDEYIDYLNHVGILLL